MKGDRKKSDVTFLRVKRLLSMPLLPAFCAFITLTTGGKPFGPEIATTEASRTRAVQYLLEKQLADGSWRLAGSDRFALAGAACGGLALFQAGLPKHHRALTLVDALLSHHPPMLVYDAAVRVQFVHATQPKDRDQRLERAAEVLMAPRHEYFNYGQPGQELAGDLSNHQFALIALEILDRYELGPTKKQWEQLTETLLSAQLEDSGWGYFKGSKSSPTMRLAGVACLGACWQAITRHQSSSRLISKTESAISRALAHADREWLLDLPRHQAPLNRWIYYGLATLERAMALAPQASLESRDWYLESEKFLIETQRANGSWASQRGEATINTMLGLLTLNRATAATGGHAPTSPNQVFEQRWLSPPGESQIVATGTSPCTAFVNLEIAAGEELIETNWSLDGKPLGTSSMPKGAIRFSVASNGELHLKAVCKLGSVNDGLYRDVTASLMINPTGLVSPVEAAQIDQLHETVPATLHGFAAECSSSVGGVRGPQWAFDGTRAASWRWKPTDQSPWIEASWKSTPRCLGIRLVPYTSHREGEDFTHAIRIRMSVNGKKKLWSFPNGLDQAGQFLAFPSRRKLKALRVEILPYTSDKQLSMSGFSEIELIAHGKS